MPQPHCGGRGGAHLPCWDPNADIADGHDPSVGKMVDLGEVLELQHVVICPACCNALTFGQDILVFLLLLSSLWLKQQFALQAVIEEPGPKKPQAGVSQPSHPRGRESDPPASPTNLLMEGFFPLTNLASSIKRTSMRERGHVTVSHKGQMVPSAHKALWDPLPATWTESCSQGPLVSPRGVQTFICCLSFRFKEVYNNS